jgi:cell wall-associated NlpC family hydrolase
MGMDRRRTAMNDRVAAAALQAVAGDRRLVEGEARRIAVPVADLLNAPEGRRERQLLCGEAVTLYEERAGWAFVQAARDGYAGYLRCAELAADFAATHRVSAPATHVYSQADFKSPERCSLSYASQVAVTGEEGRFAVTPEGFIPRAHLAAAAERAADPVAVAEMFLGTPYLWGGNSRFGIDCSGLVQAALLACGLPCPGDSDQQEAETGGLLPEGTAARRGDLLFWKGHVALVRDAETLIHANAHHMAVALEPLQPAIARILEQGDGPVTAHKRLAEFS